jgi:hypothetical protein
MRRTRKTSESVHLCMYHRFIKVGAENKAAALPIQDIISAAFPSVELMLPECLRGN